MLKRLSSQSVAAGAVLAILAVVGVVTSGGQPPVGDSFESSDYRGGGYRAWADLLSREGVATARFVLRPIELDDRIDTLVSAQPVPGATDPASRTPADLAALAAWVRDGGRLIYIGRASGLAAAETRLLELPFRLPDVGARSGQTGRLTRLAGPLAALGTDRMLLVEHSGTAEVSDGNGDIVVRYPLGRGEIVAVVDAVPFTNTNITAPGNARLAYLLGFPRRPGGIVAFDDGVHGVLRDRPWYRALPVPVRVTLAILALAGLVAVVENMLPNGPPIRLSAAREPTSAEFVDALATLHERIGARSTAATTLARAALTSVARVTDASAATSPEHLLVRRLVDGLENPIATDAALLASAELAYTVRKEWRYGRNRDGRRPAFAGRTRARHRR